MDEDLKRIRMVLELKNEQRYKWLQSLMQEQGYNPTVAAEVSRQWQSGASPGSIGRQLDALHVATKQERDEQRNRRAKEKMRAEGGGGIPSPWSGVDLHKTHGVYQVVPPSGDTSPRLLNNLRSK